VPDISDPAPLDPAQIEWARVWQSQYLVRQQFRYEYPDQIHDLRHQLMVMPPETFADQHRTTYRLAISEAGEVITRLDAFANTVVDVRIPNVKQSLVFDVQITLERSGPPMARALSSSWLTDPRLLRATPRTEPTGVTIAIADELRASGATGLALAELVNSEVHRRLEYLRGVTGIDTTAARALEIGGGVCQDFSHVMISICRTLGLPSLYVSGHQLGEGGTHSWVEVLLPAADGSDGAEGWALDPTHGCHADLTYLTVAVGRDYSDVAPTSGRYRAGHGGTLSGQKDVQVTGIRYAD
jgi:transglutaminase-like putative cysteine protease